MFKTSTYIVLAVIATSFMYANVTKAQYVTPGLVGYWSFDDNTIQGDTIEDVYGDNDGTIRTWTQLPLNPQANSPLLGQT